MQSWNINLIVLGRFVFSGCNGCVNFGLYDPNLDNEGYQALVHPPLNRKSTSNSEEKPAANYKITKKFSQALIKVIQKLKKNFQKPTDGHHKKWSALWELIL